MNSLDGIKTSQSAAFKKMNPHIFGPDGSGSGTNSATNIGGEDDEEHEHIAALTAKKPVCQLVAVSNENYPGSASHLECAKHGRDCPQLTGTKPAKPKKRIRQATAPEMNQLETEWFHHIHHLGARPQAIKLKLARSVFYKPDFFSPRTMTAWEVKGLKGKNIDRGKLALKVAATAWPEIKFILVWKDEQGVWQEQVVLP